MYKNLAKKNIYPLTEENLNALLNHYFTDLPKEDVLDLLDDLFKSNFTLKELEALSEEIQPYIALIKEELNFIPTQSNILHYAIDVFINELWSNPFVSQNRRKVIYLVREKAGIIRP